MKWAKPIFFKENSRNLSNRMKNIYARTVFAKGYTREEENKGRKPLNTLLNHMRHNYNLLQLNRTLQNIN